MSDTHYLYGRVRFSAEVASHFLRDVGAAGIGRWTDDGSVDIVMKVYAKTRAEAQSLVSAAHSIAEEFKHLADDLDRYVAIHDFTKPGGVRQPEAEAHVYGVGARSEVETLPEPRKA